MNVGAEVRILSRFFKSLMKKDLADRVRMYLQSSIESVSCIVSQFNSDFLFVLADSYMGQRSERFDGNIAEKYTILNLRRGW